MDIHLSEKFIDDHLADANGDFLKVYLYILRHADERPDDEQIADALNMTEKDVRRAVTYWSRRGGTGKDAGSGDAGSVQTDCGRTDIGRLSENDEFRALLHALQNYVGKRFTPGDAEILGYIYDRLGFSSDLIEYLFEVCMQKGKTGMRYIEKVAQGWYEKGIHTVDDAKKDTAVFAAEIKQIRSHMGISSRDLARSELDYIDRWLRTWKMPSELICEACDRTVLSAGRASFAYADSILKSWYETGVRTRSQLTEHDRQHTEERERSDGEERGRSCTEGAHGGKAAKAASQRGKSNSFHNFDERNDGTVLDADVMDKFNDLFK